MNKFFGLALVASVTLLASCDKRENPAYLEPLAWDARSLGAQDNPDVGSFFSPANGRTYVAKDSANMAGNEVEFSLAVMGADPKPTLVSMKVRKALGLSNVKAVGRDTYFGLTGMTKEQFDTVSNRFTRLQIGDTSFVALDQGKVYSFRSFTPQRSGLIYVSNIENGTTTQAKVTMDVRFAK